MSFLLCGLPSALSDCLLLTIWSRNDNSLLFFFSPECDIMCNLKLLLSAIFWSHQMHLRGSPHDQLSRQIRTLKGERKIRPRPSPRPPCQPPRRQPNALVCPPPPQWHPSPPQQPQPAPLSAVSTTTNSDPPCRPPCWPPCLPPCWPQCRPPCLLPCRPPPPKPRPTPPWPILSPNLSNQNKKWKVGQMRQKRWGKSAKTVGQSSQNSGANAPKTMGKMCKGQVIHNPI